MCSQSKADPLKSFIEIWHQQDGIVLFCLLQMAETEGATFSTLWPALERRL